MLPELELNRFRFGIFPPLRRRVGLEKTSRGQLRTDPRAKPEGLSGAARGMSFPDLPDSGGGNIILS